MIIIDGHNLIGATKSIKLTDPNAKEKILEMLSQYQEIIGRKIVVVFDRNSKDGYEFGKFKKLDIHYPLGNESADDVIVKLIDKHRDQHGYTIISSDNKILDKAKRAHLPYQTSQSFYTDIENALLYANKDTDKHLSPMEVDKWIELFKKRKK